MFINKHLKFVEPYKVTSQDIWRYKKAVIKLDWNEEEIRNENVEEALIEFIKEGKYNYYPDVEAYELKKVLSEFHNVDIENLSVFNGSDEALDVICRTFLNSGDNVLVRNPEYSNFFVFVKSMGANLIMIFQNDPFILNENDLFSKLKIYEPKIFYLSNPNNPTGIFYDPELIIYMVKKFPSILFLLDEAYIHFAFDKQEDIDCILNKVIRYNFENVIITRTFSKLFGLAGLRIGYVISNKNNIEKLQILRKGKNILMISQYAAIVAIKNWGYYNNERVKIIENRKSFSEKFKNINYIESTYDSKGNFFCFKISNTIDKNDFDKYLLTNKVYIRDRSNYKQMDRIYRITVLSDSKKMETAYQILKEYRCEGSL